MKLKFETTRKEKHVFSIIFAIMLIISNGAVTYFSADEIEKHFSANHNFVIGMWMLYAWIFSSTAIFNYYNNKFRNTDI